LPETARFGLPCHDPEHCGCFHRRHGRTLIRLWTIPSSIAAVREISGVETAKAVVFMIVGALVTVAANGAAFVHSDALAAELPIMRRSLV
jgi:hypothetical protein